jgi:hypothetical protein
VIAAGRPPRLSARSSAARVIALCRVGGGGLPRGSRSAAWVAPIGPKPVATAPFARQSCIHAANHRYVRGKGTPSTRQSATHAANHLHPRGKGRSPARQGAGGSLLALEHLALKKFTARSGSQPNKLTSGKVELVDGFIGMGECRRPEWIIAISGDKRLLLPIDQRVDDDFPLAVTSVSERLDSEYDLLSTSNSHMLCGEIRSPRVPSSLKTRATGLRESRSNAI